MEEWVRAEISRIDAENDRQNKRLEMLEGKMETQTEMLLTIQKIAINTENIAKEQTKQGELIEKQGERLESLEKQPAAEWSSAKKTVFNTVLGAVVGFIITLVGALLLFGIKNLI